MPLPRTDPQRSWTGQALRRILTDAVNEQSETTRRHKPSGPADAAGQETDVPVHGAAPEPRGLAATTRDQPPTSPERADLSPDLATDPTAELAAHLPARSGSSLIETDRRAGRERRARSDRRAVPMPPSVELTRDRRPLRLRVAVWIILGLLVAVSALAAVEHPLSAVGVAQLGLVAALTIVFLVQRRAAAVTGRRRTAREQSFTRILQGLSRSISPDSVVDAIIEELRASSEADHVVVARQAEPDGTIEVTLVAASPAVPKSRTFLRPDILGSPADDPAVPGVTRSSLRSSPSRASPPALRFQQGADEVARRVRSGYGLSHTLAAPLVAEGRFVGALILSKRTRGSWMELDRRLLTWAAAEVSAAFGRAFALEEAEALANIDSLTGLPNRRYLDELISIVPQRRREGDTLGALMIDIDRFKRLNDRYGHATGDAVLRAVASAIYVTTRAEDTPARYGGEEFAVILRRASALQSADVAERVRQAVAAIPPERLGIERPVTVSVGVAVAAEADVDVDVRTLIERADRALYLAKRRGRDRVEVA